ncbi:hypothetical protein LB505_007479 [Fusarium chuoi]|nr:hypothetical protein LB505_007479 [Fusarium chuoi]
MHYLPGSYNSIQAVSYIARELLGLAAIYRAAFKVPYSSNLATVGAYRRQKMPVGYSSLAILSSSIAIRTPSYSINLLAAA